MNTASTVPIDEATETRTTASLNVGLPFCAPYAPALHWTVVSELHAVVEQTVLPPIWAVGEVLTPAKFSPEIVTVPPPVAAAFLLNALETAGASNVTKDAAVPVALVS